MTSSPLLLPPFFFQAPSMKRPSSPYMRPSLLGDVSSGEGFSIPLRARPPTAGSAAARLAVGLIFWPHAVKQRQANETEDPAHQEGQIIAAGDCHEGREGDRCQHV